MSAEINLDCEAARMFGDTYDAEPLNLGTFKGSPERAMQEVDLNPGEEPFCGAEKCTLTTDLIIEWSVASALKAPNEPELANTIRRTAGKHCYMLGRLAAYPSDEA